MTFAAILMLSTHVLHTFFMFVSELVMAKNTAKSHNIDRVDKNASPERRVINTAAGAPTAGYMGLPSLSTSGNETKKSFSPVARAAVQLMLRPPDDVIVFTGASFTMRFPKLPPSALSTAVLIADVAEIRFDGVTCAR